MRFVLPFLVLSLFVTNLSAQGQQTKKKQQSEQVETEPQVTTADDVSKKKSVSAVANTFIIFLAIGAVLYFVPTVIAIVRGHGSWAAIAVLNVLLGWTVICWIIALIWSFTEVQSRQHIHRHYHD